MGTITAMAEALPHLLIEVPKDLTPEVRRTMIRLLQQQLNDDAVAIKLGRAFMLGRLHQVQEVRDAFDPFGKPACETIDECNLYAGGYQYDLQDGQNGNSKTELLRKFLKMDAAESEERIKRVAQIMHDLQGLAQQEEMHGLTLELVDTRCNLRMEMHALTMRNLMTVMKTLEIRLLMDSYEEPPIAVEGIEKMLQQYFGAKE
jgi:hypothetical protein